MKFNYSWDGEENPRVIIFRRMLYDSPKKVLEEYGKEKLREIFWEFWFQFDRRNLNFWKLVLEISDEEFKRKTKGSIRKAIKIWGY